MGATRNRYRPRFAEKYSAVCAGAGSSQPGFIKDLPDVAAYQNQQQSLYQLRETALKNSMTKQKQQSIAALAIGALLILALIAMSAGS